MYQIYQKCEILLRDLQPRNRRLFNKVNGGDLEALKQLAPSLNELRELYNDRNKFVFWVIAKNNQKILDYFYSVALKHHTNNQGVIRIQHNEGPFTILHWAIYCRQSTDTVVALIEQGANVNAYFITTWDRHSQYRPLRIAIENGYVDLVETLIKNGAHIHDDFDPLSHKTVFQCAAFYGQLDVLKVLLEKKELKQVDYFNAMMSAINGTESAINGDHLSCVTALLESKDFNINDENHGSKLLVAAVLKNFLDIVMALLEKGVDVNKLPSKYGRTPVYIASEYGHTMIAKILIQKGANLDIPYLDPHSLYNKDYRTPLYIARKKNHHAIVYEICKHNLLKYEDEVNAREDDHYKTTIRFFGHEIAFGCPAKKKKEATSALKEVVFNKAEKTILQKHEKALSGGKLADIYRGFNL